MPITGNMGPLGGPSIRIIDSLLPYKGQRMDYHYKNRPVGELHSSWLESTVVITD